MTPLERERRRSPAPARAMRRPALARSVWVALATSLFLATPAAPAPATGWVCVRTPGFEIYADGGERMARRAARRLEQLRQAFAGVDAAAEPAPLPVKVYLLGSRNRFAAYRPTPRTRGFFQGAPEADYIVVDASSAERRRILSHEYVHVVLNHTSVRLPQWLEEGLAEFYSTIAAEDGRLIAGRAIHNHVAALRTAAWFSADDLAAVGRDSPVYAEDDRTGIFYAQSWALVHMLLTSPPYRERVARWFALLTEGAKPEEAFRRAFEQDFRDAVGALKQYVARGAWPVVEYAWEPLQEAEVQLEALDEERARLALLDLELALGAWGVTERELEKLARRRRNSARVETARALLALSRKQYDAALAHFDRAIELGSRDARVWLEYAMLLKERGAPREEVQRRLEKAVELNPRYAEAWLLLGLEASAEGRHADAARAFEQAVRVLPRQSHFWHALALAYHRSGRDDEARNAARRALQAARTPHEREMAEAAIRLLEEPSDWAPLGARPEVETPAAWFNPRGDRSAEGVLVRVDCLGEQARLILKTGEATLRLLVADPGKVVLRNAGAVSAAFACGPQKRRVTVEYAARSDPATETDGVVTAIEFRSPP